MQLVFTESQRLIKEAIDRVLADVIPYEHAVSSLPSDHLREFQLLFNAEATRLLNKKIVEIPRRRHIEYSLFLNEQLGACLSKQAVNKVDSYTHLNAAK
jgi:hypothetical protein